MKKFILALLILTIGMASCSKQGVETEQIAKPVMFTMSVNGVQNPEIFHIK